MILIWKGWGIAVVGLLILSAFVVIGGATVVAGTAADEIQGWLPGPVCLLAAAMIFFLGRHLDDQPSRVFIEKATGQEFTIRRTHSLFFIGVSHWAPILAIVGVVLLGVKAFGG
ncbi:MAG: hypothetical protein JSR60_17890 [Proteobacteria bacterium]|nr:hypothetical protein [Pseudomonadota bacterium]